MAEPDYYTLLGIPKTASADAVRAAFHELARKYHPDRWTTEPESERNKAAALYRRGAEAYRVLMDSADRVRYDQGLARGELRLAPQAVDTAGGRTPPASATLIKSAKARPFWQKANEAIKTGDFKSAKLNLKLALMNDPGNAVIEALLKEVESR